MMRFSKLFCGILFTMRNLTKKAYTKGLVIISAGMITVLLLGTNGFIVQSKTNPEKLIEKETIAVENVDLTQEIQPVNALEQPQSLQLTKEEEDVKPTLETAQQAQSTTEEAVIYTEEDYTALVQIVEAEATGEDVIGKIMVANVVLNRVNNPRFPDTIYDVVYQRNSKGRAQFSPVDDGRLGSLPIKDSTYEAVNRALQGEDYSNGALYFVASSLTSAKAVSWFENSLVKATEHGVHEFYK